MRIDTHMGELNRGGLAFAGGWFAGSSADVTPNVQDWRSFNASGLRFWTHPRLKTATARYKDYEVTVLGEVVDIENSTTSSKAIVKRLISALAVSKENAVRYVAYLGGRFTVVMSVGEVRYILTDCSATMSVFWHFKDASLSLSSHSHLLAETHSLELDEVGNSYIPLAKEMKTGGTLYVPGIRTPFIGVRPVLPNHLLTVNEHGPQHARFYPFPDTELESDPDKTYEVFADVFSEYTRLLCGLGKTAFSITSGLDSRTALAAALPHIDRNSLTWTYIFDKDAPEGMVSDAIYGSRVANAAKLPHQLIPLGGTRPAEFAQAYDRTFRYTKQMPALPLAYYQMLPRDIMEFQCMVAEIGTGFYKGRGGQPTVDRLSSLYCRFDFGKTDLVRDAWDEHLEYAPLPDSGPVDFHDLFYWETRIGRWGALRIQEVDLVHRIVSPFNSRAVLEALQGPAIAERRDKQALSRFVEDRAPHLNVAAAKVS